MRFSTQNDTRDPIRRGVRHFEVRLWEASGETQLTVSASGLGFVTEAAKASRGLCLISMAERLKMLNGTFSIESRLQHGTTIHAPVPFSLGEDFFRAVE
jgi:signal transduction histidine kinase